MTSTANPFGSRSRLRLAGGEAVVYRLDALEKAGLAPVHGLPVSLKVILEALLRNVDGHQVREEDVASLASWRPDALPAGEIPFKPARVLMQDFTGVPAVVDLAALRAVMSRLGGDPRRINPRIPVDLVVDHSIQVDRFGSPGAAAFNLEREFERNRERYALLRWAGRAFEGFRVVPPNTGIVHQVNIESLATVVAIRDQGGETQAFPDSVLGTDSHTTMVNGLGVVGWGVGGIEAEAVMLGQPFAMVAPQVVGMRLTGELPAGATATDLVLTVTERLRRHGVVGKFVEFFGNGLSGLSLADRATVANMAPEYGATMGFFPVDDETLAYLKLTGRSAEQVDAVERYCKEQGMFHLAGSAEPAFSEILTLDMSTVEPCLAGPRRPQDRVPLGLMKQVFRQALEKDYGVKGNGTSAGGGSGTAEGLTHGAVVIAALTSCTNTSNPDVMIGAGLLARNAVARGLRVPPYVKTSLAPGSRVVTRYLETSGLLGALEQLGFHVVGYGCTTCIGNSGPLPQEVSRAIQAGRLVAASVLSGNRNFEGRVNPEVKANYLASPPLVVAFALAGTVDIDLTRHPLGSDPSGRPVMLSDVWPRREEIRAEVSRCLTPEVFKSEYKDLFAGHQEWNAIAVGTGDLFPFAADSTYIREPPFLEGIAGDPAPLAPIKGMRVLALLGDSVTTDHISPAGSIPPAGPAGRHLIGRGVPADGFNSYGARRGNHEVMLRGTFANIRIRNRLAPGTEGGLTRHLPDGAVMTIFEAAELYRDEGIPLMVIAGKEYGTGSSRDWAAKGTLLLGVRAVLAEGFERIHRSNLVGMGVVPLQFLPGQSAASLGLTGEELFSLPDLGEGIRPGQEIALHLRDAAGMTRSFPVRLRVDSATEVQYLRHGGILPAVLREFLRR